ncbi:MAG: N-acetylmuramic acid 6-phosphate etherase [Bacillota bacterium]
MTQDSKKRITEKRNSNSMKIDEMNTDEILKLINKEDKKVAEAVNEEISNIEKVIDKITKNMQNGGRLFYIGAGTSGRLGVLDAVECEPTFSISPDRVVGILAGGKEAMFRAQENIEDNEELGAKKITEYNVGENDSVVGIAASGKTPFVLGAIKEGKKRGAFGVGLSCTKESILANISDVAITPIVGPEVITGSTRMKAGTAQKMVLNMISTTVMIKLGKVYSNLMVDLNPTNEKLRSRAQDIFTLITNSDHKVAQKFLDKADYRLKEAIIMYRKGVDMKKAKLLLKENNGLLKKILTKE